MTHQTTDKTQDSFLLTVKELQPYYNVIKVFREEFEKHNRWDLSNPFVCWPTPNPFYHRSFEGLLLVTCATERFDTTTEDLVHFISPFGEIKLNGGGFADDIVKFDRSILSDKNLLDIVDVTDKIKRCEVFDTRTFVMNRKYKHEYKIYLVKKIKDMEVPQPKNLDEIWIADYVGGSNCYDRDMKLFSDVSGGTNRF